MNKEKALELVARVGAELLKTGDPELQAIGSVCLGFHSAEAHQDFDEMILLNLIFLREKAEQFHQIQKLLNQDED